MTNEQKKFTIQEKKFLRTLPDDFNWLARDKDDMLVAFKSKPHKNARGFWLSGCGEEVSIGFFDFKSIKSKDDEPCEFRKFLD